jgi:hypothetical protein
MMKKNISTLSISILFCGLITVANASYILFDEPTDTISISGQTFIDTSMTIEAQIFFTSEYNGEGTIFREWTNGLEDKQLSVGPNTLGGYSYPASPGASEITATPNISIGGSHHIAYVYDGVEERLYLDGVLQNSRFASGSLGNASGYAPTIGGSFVGYMDAFRMSDIARYNTSTFLAPEGDFVSDSNTMLLYNFTEILGSTTIVDLSGNGHNGTLGVGFSGATSPILSSPVPAPSVTWLFSYGLIGLIGMRKKTKCVF